MLLPGHATGHTELLPVRAARAVVLGMLIGLQNKPWQPYLVPAMFTGDQHQMRIATFHTAAALACAWWLGSNNAMLAAS
jgi:uncharacterized membrane protein